MRNLVYFVVGGDPNYSKLLETCVHSIRTFSENDDVDILVICATSYKKYVEHLPVKVHTNEMPDNLFDFCFERFNVFSAPISTYDNVLYLDCDIVVTGSLHPLFAKVTEPDVLYVKPEHEENSFHTHHHFSRVDSPYTKSTLEHFERNGIYVVCSGHFAFRPSKIIKNDFGNLYKTPRCTKNFADQPYFNHYFNLKGNIRYDIKDFVHLMAPGASPDENILINHFCCFGLPYDTKLKHMEALRKIMAK
jgi:lipopolysaccharide biosynthesis glycosyltransferase